MIQVALTGNSSFGFLNPRVIYTPQWFDVNSFWIFTEAGPVQIDYMGRFGLYPGRYSFRLFGTMLEAEFYVHIPEKLREHVKEMEVKFAPSHPARQCSMMLRFVSIVDALTQEWLKSYESAAVQSFAS